MRTTLFVALLAAAGVAASAGAIDWTTDLDRARARARTENKLVLVDFWAESYQQCKAMDVKTWSRPDVGRAASRFVCVRTDVGTKGNSESEYYRVKSLPMLLVLDRKGSPVLRVAGFRGPADMIELLERLPGRLTQLDSLEDQLAQAPAEIEPALGVVRELMRHGLFELSARLCRKLLKTDPVRWDPARSEQVEMLLAMSTVDADAEKGIKGLTDCLDRYPDGALRREQLTSLVRSFAALDLQEPARRYLGMLQREFPGDSLTQEAGRLVASRW